MKNLNSKFLTTLLNNVKEKHTDLTLFPGGVSVHKSLLSKLSPLLHRILSGLDSIEGDTLLLPQVESGTVEKMVQLVYSGR